MVNVSHDINIHACMHMYCCCADDFVVVSGPVGWWYSTVVAYKGKSLGNLLGEHTHLLPGV